MKNQQTWASIVTFIGGIICGIIVANTEPTTTITIKSCEKQEYINKKLKRRLTDKFGAAITEARYIWLCDEETCSQAKIRRY